MAQRQMETYADGNDKMHVNMDIQTVEKTVMLFHEMCRMHPEICPHDYEWKWSRKTGNNNELEECHYACTICGAERVDVKRKWGYLK